ncbi:MAG: ribbon-helix-helix domain-containing protein [Thermomicrobiales bacterium]|nr:ribbon-helix-helix domain-containing protein [Thermomicrobiales bacterium]
MHTTIEIDDKLKQALDERARDAGTSTSELAAVFIRAGLERSSTKPPRSGAPANGSHHETERSNRARLSNGLPQLYLEPGIEVSLDTLTDILNAVEADDTLGSPLSIDPATRTEVMTQARERNVPVGIFAARLLQQSLLYRKEWPSWHGIPQLPTKGRQSYTAELIEQLKDELD